MNRLLWSGVMILLWATLCPALELTNSQGTVRFNHDEHKMYVPCQTCHHANQESCRRCHPKNNAFGRAKIFHMLCRSCHKSRQSGPTHCQGCHQPKEAAHTLDDSRLGE
nr:cytochrome c3 family protein [uncultured Desulfuromonas sp.]